jgi:hypothetical protein
VGLWEQLQGFAFPADLNMDPQAPDAELLVPDWPG